MLRPPDVRDWVPDNHQAHFVIEAVEGMNPQGATVGREFCEGAGTGGGVEAAAGGPNHRQPGRDRLSSTPPRLYGASCSNISVFLEMQ